jgi:hypothetical protein
VRRKRKAEERFAYTERFDASPNAAHGESCTATTFAYRPVRNIFSRLRAWPKTCPDFPFGKTRYLGLTPTK